MHTITTFSTKGGAGRSTTVMALACGFLELGKRVAIMDCTGQVGWQSGREMPTTLEAWGSQLLESYNYPDRISLVPCNAPLQIEDEWASARTRGCDIMLIDTQNRLEVQQTAALGLADLVIAPATGVIEAQCMADRVQDILGFPDHLFGVVTGCRNGAAEEAETRAAFGDHPVFRSELPKTEILADLTLVGDMAWFVSSLACKPREAGYARHQDALAAWRAVQQLTLEVQWALDGHRLQPFTAERPAYPFHRKDIACHA